MDEKATQGPEAHARVREFDPKKEERKGNGGGDGGEGRARFAEGSREQGRRAGEAAAQAGERVFDIADEAGAGVAAFTRMWADASSMTVGTAANFMLSWQRELADFFSRRIEKDLQFGRRLVDARDPGALLRLNTDYARETVSDYSTCITDIAQRTANEAHERGCQVIRGAQDAAERAFGR